MNSALGRGMLKRLANGGDEFQEANVFIPFKVISHSDGFEHEEQTYTLAISEKGMLFLSGGDYSPGMEVMVCIEGPSKSISDGSEVMFCCPGEITSTGEFSYPTEESKKYKAVSISFKGRFSLNIKDHLQGGGIF